jgi:hypothetical protein
MNLFSVSSQQARVQNHVLDTAYKLEAKRKQRYVT